MVNKTGVLSPRSLPGVSPSDPPEDFYVRAGGAHLSTGSAETAGANFNESAETELNQLPERYSMSWFVAHMVVFLHAHTKHTRHCTLSSLYTSATCWKDRLSTLGPSNGTLPRYISEIASQ